MKKRGIFTISIDLELAWKECDKPIQPQTRAEISLERMIIQRILSLFVKYDVKATWAVVGHLLLSECEWKDGRAHPEFNDFAVHNNKQDWFFQHPKTRNDHLWYGRDIVQWVKDASPRQEIASHSFCHIPYCEKSIDCSIISKDIAKAKKIHADCNLPFHTFIFPRNIIGYRHLLAREGIRVYRGKTRRWYNFIPSGLFQRFLNLVYFIAAIAPKTVTAAVDETGMVNIPDSMLLLSRNSSRSLVLPGNLIKMGIAGLSRAVERGEIFHLWFHPSNFTHKTEKQFYILEAILKHAQKLRDESKLDILTMQEAAEGKGGLLCGVQAIKIREKAIAEHNKAAHYFENEYQNLKKDYFQSAFIYGRKKLEVLLDRTLDTLEQKSRVLDIGCGTGEQMKLYRSRGFEVVGIEPAKEMRLLAQKNNPGIQVINSVITDIPFADESFDFISAFEVLRYFHSADIQAAYRQMLRVLKPNGLLYFTMVNRYALDGFYIYNAFMKITLGLLRREEPVHCQFTVPGEIRRALQGLGVRDITFYGRMFAPLRPAYKISPAWTAKTARALDPFLDALAEKRCLVPLAGHLVVVAKKQK